jgi:hypothetical protein
MKLHLTLTILLGGLFANTFAQTPKTDIVIMGCEHLAQLYKSNNPYTDVLTPNRQKEIQQVANLITDYKPDALMVEVLPERQHEIDSLYNLYIQNKLNVNQLPDGRSEVYQLAFRIGKQLNLRKVYCVNAPGGTSQSILDNGDNIDIYKKEGVALRSVVTEKYATLQNGKLSLIDLYQFLNMPQTYNMVYHLRYITPARVTNGKFKNPDSAVDTAFVNPKYIGAELISVFKNRDYKIYSNIVTTVNQVKSKRALLIIGAAHIGSLKNILRDDEEYTIVDANKYLKK